MTGRHAKTSWQRLQHRAARRLRLRVRDLQEGLKVGLIVALGLGFVVWWQTQMVV